MNKVTINEIKRALTQILPQIQGHFDLEGMAYVRIVRTSETECFAQDHTMRTFEKDGMTYADVKKSYWDRPAYRKFEVR